MNLICNRAFVCFFFLPTVNGGKSKGDPMDSFSSERVHSYPDRSTKHLFLFRRGTSLLLGKKEGRLDLNHHDSSRVKPLGHGN